MRHIARKNGFTLIELMVVVAVIAITAFIAVPSFRQVIENNRLATEANRFYSSITFARSEAVRIGDTVSLSSAAGGYGAGWCVHLAGNCNGNDILRQFGSGEVEYAANANQITFNARGEMTNASFQISIQPDGCEIGEADKRRTIVVSRVGRPAIQRGDCE